MWLALQLRIPDRHLALKQSFPIPVLPRPRDAVKEEVPIPQKPVGASPLVGTMYPLCTRHGIEKSLPAGLTFSPGSDAKVAH